MFGDGRFDFDSVVGDSYVSLNFGKIECTGFDLIPQIIFIPIDEVRYHDKFKRYNEKWAYVIYSSNFKITEEVKQLLDRLPMDFHYFGYFKCELHEKVDTEIEFTFFEKMLKEYLGDNPCIPQKMLDRLKKFPKAFEELENHIYGHNYFSKYKEYKYLKSLTLK